MTQQNTTEKYPAQHSYNGAGQENRPRKKRRRRYPAAEEKNTGTQSGPGQGTVLQPPTAPNDTAQNGAPRHDTAQNDVPRNDAAQNNAPRHDMAQNDAPRHDTAQDGAPRYDTAQDAPPKAGTAQNTVPENETAPNGGLPSGTPREPAAQAMASPATEPGATVAENIDYQAAYQEIYRDILENLRSFSPSDQVACNITEEHISEYLSNSHAEKVMQFKERREKRFFAALELIAVLAAVVLVIHYLQNNSAILVNILYIIAGLGALFLWKFQPKNDDKPDSSSGGKDR